MSPKRIILLGFAALAAVGAVVLVQTARDPQAKPAAEAAAVAAGPSILVAARDIPLGAALTPADLTWAIWPETALNPLFVDQRARPDGLTELVGFIAREQVRKGEPVFEGKVVKRGDRGYFAAILTPGYRAVALEVSPETSSAGFIQPGDRVDVLLTRGDDAPSSAVILSDVRVLAMGETVRPAAPDEEAGPKPIAASVATLELAPRDAELLMSAKEIGSVSLTLRGVELEPGGGAAGSGAMATLQAAQSSVVRVHGFGAARDVTIEATP